jgi:PEP-CTERM motif
VAADAFFFSTGDPDGKIATATRPDTAGFEIESADDFVLTHATSITDATFTGLLPSGASPVDVVVEIYRVFPKDSDVGRTSGPPTFSTPQAPTRVNSPSDVALDSRDSASGDLTFATGVLSASFTALNSVQPGIHPLPGVTSGGDGAVTGEEVQFNVTFATPFLLPADHYFFVPQVQLDSGDFLWLSAPRPIVPPGTPFPPGFTELQSWTRDAMLDPDWLRVGTDIVGGTPAPTFNAAFSLSGSTIPESSTWAMMLLGFAALGFAAWRHARQARPAIA